MSVLTEKKWDPTEVAHSRLSQQQGKKVLLLTD
jgi:hypothetical protein